MNKNEVINESISGFTRNAVIGIISSGAVVVFLTFLVRYVFYEPVLQSLALNNEQWGVLYGLYVTTAMISYLPGGILADKIRIKYLATAGFGLSAILTFWYATLPRYETLKVIFLLMGICTTFIYWGVRYKGIRLVSTDNTYSRNIGISYCIVGVLGLVVNFISMWIFNCFSDPASGFNMVLMFYAGLNIAFAIASFLLIPKFKDEIIKKKKTFDLSELVAAVKHPGVWLTTLCMFFTYTVYTSLSYTVPYVQAVFGTSVTMAALMGNIRMYGTSLFSSPVIGALATKIKSPTKTIVLCMAITAICLFVIVLAPQTAGFIIPAIILIMLLSFFMSGAYGVEYSLFTETKVLAAIFGSASGILSLIGFLPDMFVSPIAGKWLDAYGNQAYTYIFIALGISAILSMGCALLVLLYNKKIRASLQTDVEEIQA
ncbi:MFS transporter [Eubacterium aggregans]|uniref:MFS transporter n=1 Tax=Eubacterium aggregans TaxID=81409 RepID=UPI003F3B3F2A